MLDGFGVVWLTFGLLQGVYAIPEPLPPAADLWRFPGPHVCRTQLDAAERELAALHRHQERMPSDDRRVSDLI